jgi:hypothetical protein
MVSISPWTVKKGRRVRDGSCPFFDQIAVTFYGSFLRNTDERVFQSVRDIHVPEGEDRWESTGKSESKVE